VLLSFNRSAFNHGISEDELKETLADPSVREFELEPSIQGNYRVMYVGFTLAGKLLEVGVECTKETFIHVYHADKATAEYRMLYHEIKEG
jgi:hypothetical protein